jgi:adenosylhomocysteine nucleosidase
MGARVGESLQRELKEATPALVISAGFAGGLQPDLKAGDLLIGENYTDPKILDGLILGENWQVGKLLTEAAIVERAEDKRRLGAGTGCMAADLETAHMARVCQARNIPMLAVRCISDTVDQDMPVPADILLNPATGRPEPLALFRHLIANPSNVPGFNKLLKNAKTAQTQLAKGLDELLPQLLRLV